MTGENRNFSRGNHRILLVTIAGCLDNHKFFCDHKQSSSRQNTGWTVLIECHQQNDQVKNYMAWNGQQTVQFLENLAMYLKVYRLEMEESRVSAQPANFE